MFDKKAHNKVYREDHKEKIKAYREDHKEEKASQLLENKYGITLEDKRNMWRTQDGKCLICDKKLTEGKNCHVDHCHATGKVRGLLCRKCNSFLGYANDDPVILQAGIDYIRKNL